MLNRRDLLKNAAVAAPAMTLLRTPAVASTTRAHFGNFPATGFKGPIVRPGDRAYAQIKRLWNGRSSGQRPALIVRATSRADVQAAVLYAIGANIPVAVRSGGHGIEGFAMPDGALVIDLSLMKEISVDRTTGVTVVQSGCKLGDVARAAEPHGWVVPAGTVSDVGVAGLTLGGGVGYLTRQFGATIDSLVSVEVVTMDGRELTASRTENADLFWALCGAGHNYAIATSFTFQGRRLEGLRSRTLVMAPSDAQAFAVGLNEVMARAPRELAIVPLFQRLAPMPGVPTEMVGQPTVHASLVYTGPASLYDSAMAWVRLLPAPLVDLPGPTSYAALTSIIDQWMPSGRRWYNNGGCMHALSAEVVRISLDAIASAPEGCEIHFPVTGGAFHEYPEDSAALSRTGNWMYEVTAQWDASRDDARFIAWVDALAAQLAPHTLSNGFLNLNPYRGPQSMKAWFGSKEKWDRLVALKTKWDPHNRLRYNKNILPKPSA